MRGEGVGQSLGARTRRDDGQLLETGLRCHPTYSGDLTARIAQKLTSQWILSKNADRSGPIGPLVTADEAGDLRDGLGLRTRVNGETVQESTSDLQIYEAGETVAHISRTFTLHAGDILFTGTPSGVGYARDPEWLLTDGDVVEVEVDRLGVLRTPIGGTRGAPAPGGVAR
ncbi:fumarylacetoacetate hydrolase family protein [Agilicoccus flavus]|uniref:fumarylacetoacetate hydrolase family protein n=1 Tax=Agilicoccus flavus TaxID=2775968 RepID=UPI001CF6D43B|nr:fumarylacetoacetate hydrolase family protein [Agilicoccus flavus]